jgi:serine phosphatase RsbU (regulator of sigma subunit)
VATLDLDTGGMELVNFGHPLPLLLCVGQPVEEIECPPAQPAGLGCDPTVTKVQLRPGDSVLFRTDGIVDARSPSGDVFSDEALTDLLRELTDAGLPPSEVLRQVVHAVVRHRGDRDSDDATLLLMAWKRTDL